MNITWHILKNELSVIKLHLANIKTNFNHKQHIIINQGKLSINQMHEISLEQTVQWVLIYLVPYLFNLAISRNMLNFAEFASDDRYDSLLQNAGYYYIENT